MEDPLITQRHTLPDKVKVLVVDDSPLMCKAIEQILNEDDQIEVTSKATSGWEALNQLKTGRFDVCTLDVHMPGMNGLSVLKNIMIRCPLPTLMVSAFTGDGSRVTFEALRFGAVDFFKKPARNGDNALKRQGEQLRDRLKRASRVQVKAARYLRIKPVASLIKEEASGKSMDEVAGIAIIHGSTGSYSSILSIIPKLSLDLSIPVIISLGVMQENLKAFVDYLRPYSIFPVELPAGRVRLRPNHIYFLSGNQAAGFEQAGGHWEMMVEERPIETENEGAVDLILLSASECFGEDCLAAFVSGDSPYGLTGAREVLRNKGGLVVQNPAGCLAPFIPKRMIQEFGVQTQEPAEIAKYVSNWKS